MIERLRQALKNEEFVLYYHPQVEMPSARVAGMEALVRWKHPQNGVLSPGEFIHHIESSDLLFDFTRWTIQQACHQIAEWQHTGRPVVPVAVNIPPEYLLQPFFASDVLQAIYGQGISPHLLALEILERSFINQPELATRHLQQLRAHQVEVHLDDFGTGYSSLGYLRYLPVTHLKIDRSFIEQLNLRAIPGFNPVNFVTAMVQLAHSVNLCVIAEGVNQSDQVKLLSDMGCDMIQGHYFFEALPAESVWQTLEQATHSARAYRYSQRPPASGDIVLELYPSEKEEMQQMIQFQKLLQNLVGGDPISPLMLACQRFEISSSEQYELFRNCLLETLPSVPSFPVNAISLSTRYVPGLFSNLLYWRIDISPSLRQIILLADQALACTHINSLHYPGWTPELIAVLRGVPPVLPLGLDQRITLPYELFNVERVTISRLVIEGEQRTREVLDDIKLC